VGAIWVPDGKWLFFLMKKVLNLDGPDYLHSYWHDLRKEMIRFSKRKGTGGALNVLGWDGCSWIDSTY
jgi:hypothetical protein